MSEHPSEHPGPLRLLLTVTLNHNQFRAHVEPILALPEVESVVLVADEWGPELPKLETRVPPRLLVRLVGRAFAKLLVCLRIARRDRPNLVLAYNLVPHGLNAAIVSKLTGIPAAFHMIGGPEEWVGGGWRSDNKVLGRLRRPSRTLEALLLAVIRRFDVVATMGPAGREALVQRGIDPSRVIELPAAVDGQRFEGARPEPPAYDVISITSLIPRKRPRDLLEVLARLHARKPDLRAVILGRGPLEQEVRERVSALGLAHAVELRGFDPEPERVLLAARVFLLASRYEGLSIALTEAMRARVPPVVTRVGEAESLVVDGQNGFLWEVGDVERAADRIALLLEDEDLRRRLGDAAAEAAGARTDPGAVSAASRELLARTRRQ
jgi:glycosyltransferase involved in cell wall biosynthesis